MRWFLSFLCLLVLPFLFAQEGDSLDWDIDTIFDEMAPVEETTPAAPSDPGGAASPPAKPAAPPAAAPQTTTPAKPAPAVNTLLKRRGFTFSAAYDFLGGVAPGWRETPWADVEDHGYYLDRYIRMRTTLGLDAQISEVFRVRSTIQYEIPNFRFALGDFFFDYSLFNRVFIRGGKYSLSWGISPNFNFTNLLSRVPEDGSASSSYILKADIPTGIGGFQVLTLTRANLTSAAPLLKTTDFGYGAKYNLALSFADFDMGVFYKDGMPLRSFLSAKTTLWNTELYSEAVLVIDSGDPFAASGAVNLGFARDFFGDKFNVNGELFYNFEEDAYWYHGETSIRKAGVSPFVEGFNLALNLQYKFGGKLNPRPFIMTLYAPMQNSAHVVPGFRFNPLSNMELYCAMPISLGSRDGYYYNNTVTVDSKKKPIPFSVIFMLRLRGSVQSAHYF